MQRVPIRAIDLVSIGYSVDESLLEVEFKDGSIYEIYDISIELYEFMMNEGNFRYEYFKEHIMKEYLCRQIYPATH